jgi:hypothetical protein
MFTSQRGKGCREFIYETGPLLSPRLCEESFPHVHAARRSSSFARAAADKSTLPALKTIPAEGLEIVGLERATPFQPPSRTCGRIKRCSPRREAKGAENLFMKPALCCLRVSARNLSLMCMRREGLPPSPELRRTSRPFPLCKQSRQTEMSASRHKNRPFPTRSR